MDEWGRGRAAELAALCELALPAERLTADELDACLWDDPAGDSAVLALPNGSGIVAVTVQQHGDRRVGFVKLLAIEPAAQAYGHGHRLLAAAHDWAWQAGAGEMRAGDAAPFYFWPGIDVRMTRALCLFESAGYWATGASLNMSCTTTHRAPAPRRVRIHRVVSDAEAAAALEFVGRIWPNWVAETERGIEHGSCHVAAEADGSIVGFACHSVNRAGWIGPMGTDPAAQHHGVGSALLGELCKDLMVAGLTDAEIAWVGPVGFYAKAAGASVSRVFRTVLLRRPA